MQVSRLLSYDSRRSFVAASLLQKLRGGVISMRKLVGIQEDTAVMKILLSSCVVLFIIPVSSTRSH